MQRWIGKLCQREDCVFVFNDIPASAIPTRTIVRMIACSAKRSSREEGDKEPPACRRTDFSTYEHGEDKR
jgi:hypothetical protein